MTAHTCPECGAALSGVESCRDIFYRMLGWESENPGLGTEVHYLMVLSYNLQHPSLYSPEGLAGAVGLLKQTMEQGVTSSEIRRRVRARVDSGHREWKITARPGHQGEYSTPVAWTMTCADVLAGGASAYGENVRLWARSVYAALRAAGIGG